MAIIIYRVLLSLLGDLFHGRCSCVALGVDRRHEER